MVTKVPTTEGNAKVSPVAYGTIFNLLILELQMKRNHAGITSRLIDCSRLKYMFENKAHYCGRKCKWGALQYHANPESFGPVQGPVCWNRLLWSGGETNGHLPRSIWQPHHSHCLNYTYWWKNCLSPSWFPVKKVWKVSAEQEGHIISDRELCWSPV